MAKKLFIGGLSLNTTEQDLKRTFSQYGLIDDIKIVTGHSGLNKNLTQKKLTRLSKDQGKLRGIFNLCENAAFYL